MALPVMTALAAENAMQVKTAGGRSIIIQSVAGDTGRAEFDRAGRIIPLSKGVRLTEGDVLHTEGDKKYTWLWTIPLSSGWRKTAKPPSQGQPSARSPP